MSLVNFHKLLRYSNSVNGISGNGTLFADFGDRVLIYNIN